MLLLSFLPTINLPWHPRGTDRSVFCTCFGRIIQSCADPGLVERPGFVLQVNLGASQTKSVTQYTRPRRRHFSWEQRRHSVGILHRIPYTHSDLRIHSDTTNDQHRPHPYNQRPNPGLTQRAEKQYVKYPSDPSGLSTRNIMSLRYPRRHR